MKKRLFALTLALVMLLGAIPQVAAADIPTESSNQIGALAEAKAKTTIKIPITITTPTVRHNSVHIDPDFMGTRWEYGSVVKIALTTYTFSNNGEIYYVDIYDADYNLITTLSMPFIYTRSTIGRPKLDWRPPAPGVYYVRAYASGTATSASGMYYGFTVYEKQPAGWQQIDGTWYYYNDDGTQKLGWLYEGGWYFLASPWDGAMATGGWTIGDYKYYFDSNGVMQTGWQKYNSHWRYYGSSGAMQTGWVSDDGFWYYTDSEGVMQTGWVQVGNAWYYLSGSGAMVTGWLNLDGTWYYLYSDGAMATGWMNDGSNWFYLCSDGSMATGWLDLGGTWYYLNSDGTMATGTHTIDGNTYTFDGSGAWIA